MLIMGNVFLETLLRNTVKCIPFNWSILNISYKGCITRLFILLKGKILLMCVRFPESLLHTLITFSMCTSYWICSWLQFEEWAFFFFYFFFGHLNMPPNMVRWEASRSLVLERKKSLYCTVLTVWEDWEVRGTVFNLQLFQFTLVSV